jgi:hypothetical protein
MVGTKTGPTYTNMSYLKTWGQVNTITQSTTAELLRKSSISGSTNVGNVMCASATVTKTTATDKCMVLTGSVSNVNARNVYLSVSLWTN